MADLGIIDGLTTSATLRDYAQQVGRRPAPKNADIGDSSADRVEISDVARFLSQLAELPDGRARRIVDIRNAIDSGAYVTPEKLNVATERLFEEIQNRELTAF